MHSMHGLSAFFQKEQSTVINSSFPGNDAFAVLPIGFRKGLCYACLPSIFGQLLGVKLRSYFKCGEATSIHSTIRALSTSECTTPNDDVSHDLQLFFID